MQRFGLQSIVQLACIAAFIFITYIFFDRVEQADFDLIALSMIMLFGIYAYFIFARNQITFLKFLVTAILVRVIPFGFDPNLSDDIYRFVWDGRVWDMGINAFAYTPREFIASFPEVHFSWLFDLMNSPDYYTIYPPLCQLTFYLSIVAEKMGVPPRVALQAFFFVAEMLTIAGLFKFLKELGKDTKLLFIYALNPLVIIELMGNLHFECLMMTALIWCAFLLYQNKLILSGLLYGLSISTKLVPLIYAPLILFQLGWKKGMQVLIPAGFLTIGAFALMLQGHIFSILRSINLYFQSFEFNASIYYALRELGVWLTTYNQIKVLGPFLGLIAGLIIVKQSIGQVDKSSVKEISDRMIVLFTLYLFFSTTVHPWYLSVLLLLSVFSSYRFTLVWSCLIYLSYSAYMRQPTQEFLILIAVEYLIVGFFFYQEHSKKKSLQEILRGFYIQ